MAPQRGGRPTRRPTSRQRKYTIQLFVEGAKTEPQYLRAWQRQFRSSVVLIIDPMAGRPPYQLVEAAISSKAKAEQDQRRGRGVAPDSYWCVVDTDDHPRLKEAVTLANAHGVQMAVSNPCFELWLLLHYVDQRKWQHRHEVQHELKSLTGIEKTLSESHLVHLLSTFPTARSRATALDRMHDRNGSSDRNPSTGVWRLVDLIQDSGSPTG